MSTRQELLAAAVIKEGRGTGFFSKLKFWTKREEPPNAGFDDVIPDIDDAVSQLSPADLIDPETRAWQSAATQFQWGKPTIELSPTDKKRIARKINNGEKLSPGEQMWLDTSQFDTDMF